MIDFNLRQVVSPLSYYIFGRVIILNIDLLFKLKDALLDPRMLEGFFRCQSFFNFPLEALIKEIYE
jgi:hypothetical protein